MFLDFFNMENLQFILSGLIVLISMIIADRLIRRVIEKNARRIKLEKHGENIIKLTSRIIIVAVGLVILLTIYGMPTEWFVGVSALTGAAIGFASTQTVGNFLAGLYIMVSRPFMVNDYVKIGEVEGEVREITINYTKIYTPTYNITEIPNRRVLDSTIVNYSGKKNIIDYSFKVGFPHQGTNKEIIEKCILPAIEVFYNQHRNILTKKPEVSMLSMEKLGRAFMIRMFFPEGKINVFYDIQPQLMQQIVHNWDIYKQQQPS